MALLQTGIAKSTAEAGYTIDQSLRFDNGDSAYLSRTPSAGNRKTFTISVWAKLTTEQSGPEIFGTGVDVNSYASFGINSNKFWFGNKESSSWTVLVQTSAMQRDPSSWYHFLVKVDTTESVAADRVVMYINGEDQVSYLSSTTYPSLNADLLINAATAHKIGSNSFGDAHYWDGYLAEFHFIDGTALDASSFGETDSDTNQWKPIEYEGTYGDNGFYQKYANTELADSFDDSATGATAVTSFTSTGANTWTCPTGVTSAEILLVAGGAGGGGNGGGGGGAGGVVHHTGYTVVPGVVYDITVGDGGAGVVAGATGTSSNDGDDTVFNVNAEGSGATMTAVGGGSGQGPADSASADGRDGGSGGGSSYPPSGTNSGGSSTQGDSAGGTGYGNDGGAGYHGGSSPSILFGGGGGAGAVGGSGRPGNGGAGQAFSTSGASVTYAGGGGCGSIDVAGFPGPGSGGSGGGGAGGAQNADGTAGTANTGGGGGGGGWEFGPTVNHTGGDGGSGICIISYENPDPPRHTITDVGDATNQRPQPHAITAVGNASMVGPKQGTSLITFDGTGDYLSVPDSSDWDFMSKSAYTLEAWVQTTASSTTQKIFNQEEDYDNSWNVFIHSDATVKIYNINGGSTDLNITSSITVSTGVWYHIAAVKDGSDYELFIDGVSRGTGTSATSDSFSASLFIGNDIADQEFQGYMDGIRISDSARYAEAFTPPVKEFSNDSDTLFLLQSGTDGSQTFTDSSSGSHSITANGGVRWFAPKIGAGAMVFDGTGDWLTVPDSVDWNFGTGDFAVECWVNLADVSGNDRFFGQFDDMDDRWYIGHDSGSVLLYAKNGGTEVAHYQNASATLLSNYTWYHVAVVRSGSTVYCFIDGTSTTFTENTAIATMPNCSSTLFVADNGRDLSEMEGYMNDARISRFARYTSNFSEPTTALTDDINTVLLINGDSVQGTEFQDKSTGLAISEESRMKFDGNGDYLSVPYSSDWRFGSDNFTVEFWLKASTIEDANLIRFGENSDDTRSWYTFLNSDGTITFGINSDGTGSGWDYYATTGTIFAGPWVHLAFVRNGTDFKTYLNGVADATDMTSSKSAYAATKSLYIAAYGDGSYELDGYMDEIRISNSARYTTTFTPQTRGNPFTADANTKLLIHSAYGGGLGADSSGNYNTYAVTNLVATDQMKDSPTNNFATLNPIARRNTSGGTQTWSEGNLKFYNQYGEMYCISTIALPTSDKWYWESMYTDNAPGGTSGVGILQTDDGQSQSNNLNYLRWKSDGTIITRTSGSDTTLTSGKTFGENDVLGLFVDDRDVKFYKNGTLEYTASTVLTTDSVREPFWYLADGDYVRVNFGADSSFAGEVTAQGNQDANGKGDFYQTVPTGGLALCTDNLPAPEIALPTDHFNTVLYVGNGGSSTDAITGVGFQPDLNWIKNRTSANSNYLTDAVRGIAGSGLQSNASDTEDGIERIVSLDSDGFTTAGTHYSYVNTSANNYVAWNWKAGGAGSTNTDGSIGGTVTVSANPTAGFSIGTFTTQATSGAVTIGHGLAEAPTLILLKDRDHTFNWDVYPDSITDAEDYRLVLNESYAADAGGWDDTVPGASTWTFDQSFYGRSGDECVFYAFHSVEGYSKIGNYVGNGDADGTFIYCGFRPSLFLVKCSDTGSTNWLMYDNKRDPYNVTEQRLEPDTSDAEDTDANDVLDFVSNGIKLRGNGGGLNYGSRVQIYMAFAESPFKTANAR